MNQETKHLWNQLLEMAKQTHVKDLSELFKVDANRFTQLSFETEDLFLDLSKNWVDKAIMTKLIELAKSTGVPNKIKSMLSGEIINISENKPATHTAQRKNHTSEQIKQDRNKMYAVANKYQNGEWKSAFGKKIDTLITIGIGGSYLGPKLAVEALSDLQTTNDIKVLFYPSVDESALDSIMQSVDIERCLFCLSSKSLGTIETIKNTETILAILTQLPNYKPEGNNQSFVAATANFEKAASFNIPASHVMPFDNATGGRFSVWSSIGFPALMAIGEEKFKKFLNGAEKMDNHFRNTALEQNLPVLMALTSIWYRNFIGLSAYAVIPYDVRLKNLPAWLQQLMMESNGKMQDVDGKCIDYYTTPWLFGEHGQLSQHAFFQAFHQGKDILPIDFIGVMKKNSKEQNFLLINMLAQSSALMNGNKDGSQNCYCPGNRPSTTLLLKELSPSSLGQLLALYEHIVFVQSIIWNINCFDQPGVELGKKIAKNIVEHMENSTLDELHLDTSTQQLLSRILKNG